MRKVEKYGIFEAAFNETGAKAAVTGEALFTHGETEKKVSAFKNKEGEYIVRFMPQEEGIWSYQITIGEKREEGEFECTANLGSSHGLVQPEGCHFRYEDGETYIPFGTTCYAWVHQPEALQRETLSTLEKAPFNKIRMCVFPKSMPYNNNDPDCYPFEKNAVGGWDVENPDPVFWEKLDQRIGQLMELGIEADLILFHPYDRWGFARLSQKDSLTYLEYCIARLGAYRNIWWSLANEYEMVYSKSFSDWDEYGEMLAQKDVYGHLISIHNIITPYPKRSWMTHCSIQSGDIHRIILWKKEYGIPVLIDECGYEGNLQYSWGNLSAFEMVHRFWWAMCRDGFCTHGETFHREDEVLWWAKGGKLYGESVSRIAFLKELMYSLPGDWTATEAAAGNPNLDGKDEAAIQQEMLFQDILKSASEYGREKFIENTSPMAVKGDHYYLEYLGRSCPIQAELSLSESAKYRVEIIDIWEMTKTLAVEGAGGHIKIGLPQKEGIAVLAVEI